MFLPQSELSVRPVTDSKGNPELDVAHAVRGDTGLGGFWGADDGAGAGAGATYPDSLLLDLVDGHLSWGS